MYLMSVQGLVVPMFTEKNARYMHLQAEIRAYILNLYTYIIDHRTCTHVSGLYTYIAYGTSNAYGSTMMSMLAYTGLYF